MDPFVIALFALLVVAYVALSGHLDRWDITAPIVFTVGGTIAGLASDRPVTSEVVHALAEVTLALVLFHDAAQVRPRELESDASLCVRLLLVGLPLTVLLGFGVARGLMPGIGTWLALVLAASLAPTDAGLGAATVLNPAVPVRIRRILNVESGLNDGLCTPVVLFAVSAAGGHDAGSAGSAGTFGAAIAQLGIGLLVGLVIGVAAGRLLGTASRSRGIESGLLPVAVLFVPLACYYGSVALDGNGFVAAFVSGMAFASAFAVGVSERRRAAEPPDRPITADTAFLAETTFGMTASLSTALGFAVWMLFGTIGVAHLGSMFSWRALVFAVLSLTVLRMVPVALCLIRTGLKLRTAMFIGWFGPRGLASVVFALIAIEELNPSAELTTVIGSVTLTVLLSVILHGVTATPWAAAYGRWVRRTNPVSEQRIAVEPTAGRRRPYRVRG